MTEDIRDMSNLTDEERDKFLSKFSYELLRIALSIERLYGDVYFTETKEKSYELRYIDTIEDTTMRVFLNENNEIDTEEVKD